MRRLGPILVLAILASGCLRTAHSEQILRLDEPTPIAMVLILDDVHRRQSSGVPDALTERLRSVLKERNLVPQVISADTFNEQFGALRDTRRRLEQVAARTGQAELLLLVETQAVFYSQLSGRYRWTVYVKLSICERASVGNALTERFDLPAVLTHDHEREPEALVAAAQGIARRLGPLLDNYLAGTAARDAQTVDPQSIYFVMVDRFHNGDRSNDGRIEPADPAGWHGGDLQGVLDKLDYLQGLGFSTLWLSPVFWTRHERFHGHGAFHGYWTQDLNRLDPRFGSEHLLKELADELHRRDMRLVLDLVVNHVGYDAPLEKERPGWFHGRGTITDWRDSGQIVFNDVHGLPDLAQEKEDVYSFLLAAATRWLGEIGADGFRLDAVKHVSLDFWSRFNRDLQQARPGLILLGEHYDGDPLSVDRYQRVGRFTHMFDFPLAFALRDVFCEGKSPGKIGAVLSNDRLYLDPRTLVTFLDNHDMARVRTACGDDPERVRHALTAQFALRGVPALTYGTEAGLRGADEPENRGDMVFDDESFRPLKDHVAALLGLRRDFPALVRGATRILALDRGVLSLVRVLPDQVALVAINTGPGAATRALPAGRFQDALTGRECEGEFHIGPGETRLLLARSDGQDAFARLIPGPIRTRPVRVRVDQEELRAGKSLRMAGSGPELGNWDPALGAGPFERRGGRYETSVDLPIGLLFAYKLVVIASDGSARWEQRDDRYLFVTADEGPLLVELSM